MILPHLTHLEFCSFCHFCIQSIWLILPYFTQSGILFVLPFLHMTGMDDFHIFDPICNFVHFVVLSVVMSSLVVMS